jgi:hypothetical protein
MHIFSLFKIASINNVAPSLDAVQLPGTAAQQ